MNINVCHAYFNSMAEHCMLQQPLQSIFMPHAYDDETESILSYYIYRSIVYA